MILTHSNIITLLECEVKFYLEYYLGMFSRIESESLFIGRVFHAAMAEMRKHGWPDAEDLIAELCYERWVATGYNPELFGKFSLEDTEAIIKAMVKNFPYHTENRPEELFLVPKEKFPFPAPFDFAGRIDDVQFLHEKKYVFDYKTCTNIDYKNDELVLSRNTQASGYVYCRNLILPEEDQAHGMIFAYVRKPSIKQTKKESEWQYRQRLMDDYGARTDFYYHIEDTPRPAGGAGPFFTWLQRIMKKAHDIVTRVNVDLIEDVTQCVNRFGKCPFLKHCTGAEPDYLREHFEQKGPDQHPELEGLEVPSPK